LCSFIHPTTASVVVIIYRVFELLYNARHARAFEERAYLKSSLTGLIVIVGLIGFSQSGFGARSEDVDEVEKGSPTQLEDAYPLDNQELDLEGLFRWERVGGRHGYVWSPRIEYGFAPWWQVRASLPFLSGTTATDPPLNRNLQLQLQRSFNSEGLWTPALAVSTEADLPTGPRAHGVDTVFTVQASKTLGTSPALPRVHANVGWMHNAAHTADERRDLYSMVVGYTRLVTSRMMIIADFFRQQQLAAGQTENVLELGLRRALTATAVIAVGAGYGITHDSRDFHLQVGFEYTFR